MKISDMKVGALFYVRDKEGKEHLFRVREGMDKNGNPKKVGFPHYAEDFTEDEDNRTQTERAQDLMKRAAREQWDKWMGNYIEDKDLEQRETT